jgi:tetratricopeptide (TPR) repeat protein
MDRIATLKEVLAADPANILARYGLAMEYSKAGDTDAAVTEFKRLITENPNYIAAYQQGAQTLLNAERYDEARELLNQGIAVADRAGNQHAKSEMEGMLDSIF